MSLVERDGQILFTALVKVARNFCGHSFYDFRILVLLDGLASRETDLDLKHVNKIFCCAQFLRH